MAKDPAMSGPVSKLEGGTYESSEEIRDADNIPDETGEGLTRSEIINAFGDAVGRTLLDAGYASFTSLRLASDEELLAVSGLGPAKLAMIREKVGAQSVDPDEVEVAELAGLMDGPRALDAPEALMETAVPEQTYSVRRQRIMEQAEAQKIEDARVIEAQEKARLAPAADDVEDDEEELSGEMVTSVVEPEPFDDEDDVADEMDEEEEAPEE